MTPVLRRWTPCEKRGSGQVAARSATDWADGFLRRDLSNPPFGFQLLNGFKYVSVADTSSQASAARGSENVSDKPRQAFQTGADLWGPAVAEFFFTKRAAWPRAFQKINNATRAQL